MWKYILMVLRYTFSLSLIKSFASSYGYYIYEQVFWRPYIHTKPGARIHATASIKCAHNVYVGKNSLVNHQCCIWAGKTSKIVLGDNVLLGPGVKIFGNDHGIRKGTPPNLQPRIDADVVIGDGVWLGANVVVRSGVKISDGVVVGAGAVVTQDILDKDIIVGGVPARKIGERT